MSRFRVHVPENPGPYLGVYDEMLELKALENIQSGQTITYTVKEGKVKTRKYTNKFKKGEMVKLDNDVQVFSMSIDSFFLISDNSIQIAFVKEDLSLQFGIPYFPGNNIFPLTLSSHNFIITFNKDNKTWAQAGMVSGDTLFFTSPTLLSNKSSSFVNGYKISHNTFVLVFEKEDYLFLRVGQITSDDLFFPTLAFGMSTTKSKNGDILYLPEKDSEYRFLLVWNDSENIWGRISYVSKETFSLERISNPFLLEEHKKWFSVFSINKKDILLFSSDSHNVYLKLIKCDMSTTTSKIFESEIEMKNITAKIIDNEQFVFYVCNPSPISFIYYWLKSERCPEVLIFKSGSDCPSLAVLNSSLVIASSNSNLRSIEIPSRPIGCAQNDIITRNQILVTRVNQVLKYNIGEKYGLREGIFYYLHPDNKIGEGITERRIGLSLSKDMILII